MGHLAEVAQTTGDTVKVTYRKGAVTIVANNPDGEMRLEMTPETAVGLVLTIIEACEITWEPSHSVPHVPLEEEPESGEP